MNLQERIEVLKDYINLYQEEDKRCSNNTLTQDRYLNAQQWIIELEAQGDGWNRVEDGVPEIGKHNVNMSQDVLMFYAKTGKKHIGFYAHEQDQWFCADTLSYINAPTLWMPITPPTT